VKVIGRCAYHNTGDTGSVTRWNIAFHTVCLDMLDSEDVRTGHDVSSDEWREGRAGEAMPCICHDVSISRGLCHFSPYLDHPNLIIWYF
jgi:hypothetical protein